ncbi:hypothetical protein PanWU01x14_093770, partial [Parasponia andersonii]
TYISSASKEVKRLTYPRRREKEVLALKNQREGGGAVVALLANLMSPPEQTTPICQAHAIAGPPPT